MFKLKFIVKKDFKDLQDQNHVYRKGDYYPRKGRAKKDRVEELTTDQNAHGVPLIEEIRDENPPKDKTDKQIPETDDLEEQNEEVKDDE